MSYTVNLTNMNKIDATLSYNLPVVLELVPKYPTYLMHRLTHIPQMGHTVTLATSRLGVKILSIRYANSLSAHTTTSRHTTRSLSSAWCTDTLIATPSVLSLVVTTATRAHVSTAVHVAAGAVDRR
jgi:hypothetical protein